MIKTKEFVLELLAGILVITGIATFAVVVGTRVFQPAAPTPEKTKTYIVIIPNSAGRPELQGTRIEAKDGCSVVYRGETVDTVLCLPHVITEDNGPTVVNPPSLLVPSSSMRKVDRG